MKSILPLLCSLLFISPLLAQTHSFKATEFDFENYTWEEDPQPYTPLEGEDEIGEIELKYKRVLELVIEEEYPVMYSLSHTTTFLNSSEAIERNNKIYLPISSSGEVETQIARVINPDGEIIELNQDDILEAEDESTGGKYRYFALDGLEIGSTMEYINIYKYSPSLSGATFTFQNDNLRKNVSFEIIYPDHLVFEFKPYNGFPELTEDTTTEDYIRYYVEVDEIKPLQDEEYQNYNANVQKLSYKLTGNHASRNYNLNSFNSFAANIHELMYPELNKKESKIISKYIERAEVDLEDALDVRIRKIEDFLKDEIVYIEDGRNLPINIEDVADQRVAGELGLFILFAQMFQAADIKTELVATSNRYDDLFDKEFENMNHLDNFAFYFPKTKSYLAPTEILYRYPLIPYQWTENYGYFVKSIKMGGVSLGSGKVKYIKALDMQYSVDSLDVFIDFSAGLNTPVYRYYRSYTGLDAVFNQSIFTFIQSEEDKADLRKELVKVIDENMEIEHVESLNEGAENIAKKPYIISCDFTSESFIEKAGKNYLLKVGELIGPQVEMYENKERKSEIEFTFAKVYHRTVSFKIPDGYVLKNLEKSAENLNYDNEDGESIMKFKTSYNEEGGLVTITNIEYYNQIRLAIDPYYTPFRNVVNAAADFNKIVLVLEPK